MEDSKKFLRERILEMAAGGLHTVSLGMFPDPKEADFIAMEEEGLLRLVFYVWGEDGFQQDLVRDEHLWFNPETGFHVDDWYERWDITERAKQEALQLQKERSAQRIQELKAQGVFNVAKEALLHAAVQDLVSELWGDPADIQTPSERRGKAVQVMESAARLNRITDELEGLNLKPSSAYVGRRSGDPCACGGMLVEETIAGLDILGCFRCGAAYQEDGKHWCTGCRSWPSHWQGGTDANPRPWCVDCGEPQPGWKDV